MSTQEKRERIRARRKKQVAKQKMILLLALTLIITIGSIVFGTIFSTAKDPATDIPQYKYYKSITIEEGDSLWSLASTYYTKEYTSLSDYINEIKRMNGLSSDVLYAGNYLLVPHFVAE